MIASISGTVDHVGLDRAVLRVGGVGLAVVATPGTLATLRVGSEARLSTSLIVREDSLTLMGFETDDERTVFETLQTVSGIGPKVALAMLAVHTPDALRRAVAEEDLAALMRVPGIGKKGAQRVVLEIGDKLGAPTGEAGDPASTATTEVPEETGDAADERSAPVVEALTGLGWPAPAAQKAVDVVLDRAGDPASGAPELDSAGLLRAALQQLAGGRRG